MIRSITSTTGAVARTVIVFAVLFGNSVGCTGIVGMRMIVLMICASSGDVRVRDVEDADDEIVVLRVLLRVVGDDDDRLRVQDLVEELVGGRDLLQRLLERHVFEADRVRLVLVCWS